MLWRRWSVSQTALKAVTGQFVGLQTAVTATMMCVLAIWGATSGELGVNLQVMVTGLILASVGLSVTIASAWIGSGRWDDLARFPLGRDELTRATYLVAGTVIAIEAVVPISLFALLSGGAVGGQASWTGTTAAIVEMTVIGLSAGTLSLALWAEEQTKLRCFAGISLAVGSAAWWVAPVASAIIFAACALAVLASTQNLRARRRQVGTVRGGHRSLVLGELTTVRTTQVNTLTGLVIATLFTYTMTSRGLTIPLPLAFVVVNTPLNSYFSRYLSTRTLILAVPGSRQVLTAYARDLALLYIASNVLVGTLLIRLGGNLVETVAAAVTASVAAAATAVLLEVYQPLTNWKSERDVMRHPRKYLPPLAALLAVLAVHAVCSLTT